MVSTPPTNDSRPVHPSLQALWYTGCVLTLGYAPKYLRRIEGWQVYDPSIYDNQHRAYSIPIETRRLGLESSKRATQQKEWDRLMVPLSIITATSAMALAIPSPLNSHWLATAFHTAAFGLSLEGLLLTTYLTAFGSSSSAGTIGRLANGKAFLKGAVGPVAIVTALPAALATYAASFLLAGLVVMISTIAGENSVAERKLAFRTIVLLPVCTMMACLVVAVIGCEVFLWMEAKHAQPGDAEDPEELPFSVEKNGG
ncbi:unnamed protein product [Rhizoctonia solani]|uniref:Uncharacterized protein n=1 Tax=Rhizoctonia solani TaxID=456999 RepID=A0A8H3CD96_9AGAM|nr:unnamed protein product [Rhizoctonia solani]